MSGDSDGMEFEYEQIKAESEDVVADEDDDVDVDEDDDLDLPENDPDPTAGASDIGGRAAEPEGPTDS